MMDEAQIRQSLIDAGVDPDGPATARPRQSDPPEVATPDADKATNEDLYAQALLADAVAADQADAVDWRTVPHEDFRKHLAKRYGLRTKSNY